ncbi:MAG TPA: hypothetical protein VMM12_06260 [Longimicrobiales bacterium]|nr:hypothetical protein [Longimicrobiales bacterium]
MPGPAPVAYDAGMHVALTDVLTCPRCGPGHGLILVPEEVRERRVVSGFLGCADCRERYPVVSGVVDLSGGEVVGEVEAAGTEAGALGLAGQLGLAGAQGVVLLVGAAAAHASELGSLVDGVEVVATLGTGVGGASSVRVGVRLPFQSGKLRGVALTGEAAGFLLEEGARLLAPAGRLVLDPVPAGSRARLDAAGLRVLAEGGGALVAGR